MKLKIMEFFGGIGAPRKALEKLGHEIETIDYIEIWKTAVDAYNVIFNEWFKPTDIKEWTNKHKDIQIDILIQGSPCQDFSLAGNNNLEKGRSILYRVFLEKLKTEFPLKPKIIIWENVKNLISPKHREHFEYYLKAMEEMGYHNQHHVLNAKDFGIAQNRERVFTISTLKKIPFLFFPKQEPKVLKDFLEDKVDKKYWIQYKDIAHAIKNGWLEIDENNFVSISKQKNKIEWSKVQRTIIPFSKENILNRVFNPKERNSDCLNTVPTTKKIAIDWNKEVRTKIPFSAFNQENYVRSKNDIASTITASGAFSKQKIAIDWNKEARTMVTFTNYRATNVIFNPQNAISACIPNNTSSAQQKMAIEWNNKAKTKIPFTKYKAHNTVYDSDTQFASCLTKEISTSTQKMAIEKFYNKLPIFIISGKHYNIRVLTEKECWRLMGFDDEDFEKAKCILYPKETKNKMGKLYSLAGNSIVVNVLMKIFEQILNYNINK